ncbi:MFS allantoate transporter [Cordyceps javanica]|uniref:MFS allantoate transporter n=1 Tax=Cordyceps javanica TaxID=43265 RepID=A0A545V180_9HYPO|nr:MFS allantoate transporter [Cordyceps javanica]
MDEPSMSTAEKAATVDLNNADLALQILHDIEVSPEEVAAVEEKIFLRKVDLHMLPIMFTAILLFSFDKATFGYSSVMGIRRDAHLSSGEYAWLGSIFSLGYLVSNLPCAIMIQKAPLSKWIVVMMSIWGVILALMSMGRNFGELFAIRLLLGVFEASITPTFVIMTGMWYKRDEQARRLGIWYSGSGFASIVGAPIAYAIDGSPKIGVLVSWKFLYVISGALTVFVAIVFFFIVPDSQKSAAFLSPAEKVYAIERLRVNQQGIGNRKFKWYQVRELLLDPRTYLLFGIQYVSNIGWGATSIFSPLLIQAMGYSSRNALILNIPRGAVILVSVLVACYMADRMRDKTMWAAISAAVGMLFGALCFGLQHKSSGAALAAYALSEASTPLYILTFSMVSENTAGHTKKLLTQAILLVGSTTGTLTGPQITKDDPEYTRVKVLIIVCPAIALVFILTLRFLNMRSNRHRDAIQAAQSTVHVENSEFLDLTDGENPEFRYAKAK